ncbi:YqeG family HAD IIIA-type phosphatase [Exiguobacterium profundum]|uniref:HAD superfamily (Subfamily IIIA) phosphatase, TIGR01668 n=2 Tax=Exiguobacterium TaxID=33986 RepID=C4L3U0_EXISA|nr:MULTISPECIES: YqeG family HAD IIIA-type phosphatase [Exiguobacterium]MBG0918360.1 YqeG family HAD IIIA-type phosphatase [Exiguobacterium sp. SRB7LM]MCM3280162.1 YqeG family HAD IIIA-type phosphatase [Exiguobacterium sp. MER 193]ACQ71435.1 HAD superfamily (subfamily IIIA) phosphatase, TIGR01668 [Exiguobacterium sp. AT1b]MBQ6459032.1 YqeG family HAD IIIA-type phosphatase [Exiguobacterium sp.]MCT4799049.1 YqeG family HAD IIIA-type phosphatase [Exiguobacterium profundum]
MFNRLYPKQFVASVFDIDLQELKDRGVRVILTDLDNTLVAWDVPHAPELLLMWLEKVKSYGFDVIVVSNNNENRVRTFTEPLGLHYVARARKPLPSGFKAALSKYGYSPKEAIFLGDQLFTDVLGANMAGIHVIHVQPVVKTDGLVTKFNRMLEKVVFAHMKRRGKYVLITKKVEELAVDAQRAKVAVAEKIGEAMHPRSEDSHKKDE